VAWDSSRPVPWQRLVREWLLYVAVMAVVLVLFFSTTSLIGVIAGLLVSGPLYLAFGYVLAKFGYQRKTLKQLRAETPAKGGKGAEGGARSSSGDADPTRPRPKPAPTSRTGGGTANRPKRKR
jgi:uncharacterized membrane protein YgcG